MLTIRLLGTIDYRLNGESVPSLTTGRPAALMAFLCITSQPQHRTTIAHLLWDSATEQQARSNLRYALRDLRRAVGDYVIVDGEHVAFNQNLPHWIDCTTFTEHLKALAKSSAKDDSALLPELLNLYVGDFLADFQIGDAMAFDDWVIAQRRRIHDLFVQGLHLRIQEQLNTGEYAAGLALNQYLLDLEPWREEAHRQRMILFAHSNQRSAALKQYEVCRRILADELDVPPMAQTTSLYEQIKTGQWFVANAGPTRTTTEDRVAVVPFHIAELSRNGQTPARPTPTPSAQVNQHIRLGSMPELVHFVGRQDELGILRQWSGQERCAVIAILGLAGTGKSALAAALVQEAIEEDHKSPFGFDRIIWQSLDYRPTCVETVQSWLSQLEPDSHSGRESNFDLLVSHLFDILDTQRALLVLDGIEAVTAPSSPDTAAYDRLLRLFFQRSHRSCLLLTSRTRPSALSLLDERNRSFRWLELRGLPETDALSLLAAFGLGGDPAQLGQICSRYAGNPLLLTQAAELIHGLFNGDQSAFVQEDIFFLGEIGERLYRQLHALSPIETGVLKTLADVDAPLTREALWQQMTTTPDRSAYLLALRSLQNAFLIRTTQNLIHLPELLAHFFQEQRLSYH